MVPTAPTVFAVELGTSLVNEQLYVGLSRGRRTLCLLLLIGLLELIQPTANCLNVLLIKLPSAGLGVGVDRCPGWAIGGSRSANIPAAHQHFESLL